MAVSQVEESLFFPLGFHTLHNWTLSPVLFQTLPIYPPSSPVKEPGIFCLLVRARLDASHETIVIITIQKVGRLCLPVSLCYIVHQNFLFLFFLLLFHSKVEERIWKNWPVSKLKRRPINATTTRIPMRERIPSVQDPNSWFLTISRSRKNLDKISFYSPRKEKGNFPIFRFSKQLPTRNQPVASPYSTPHPSVRNPWPSCCSPIFAGSRFDPIIVVSGPRLLFARTRTEAESRGPATVESAATRPRVLLIGRQTTRVWIAHKRKSTFQLGL